MGYAAVLLAGAIMFGGVWLIGDSEVLLLLVLPLLLLVYVLATVFAARRDSERD